jgi:hypothetical protein
MMGLFKHSGVIAFHYQSLRPVRQGGLVVRLGNGGTSRHVKRANEELSGDRQTRIDTDSAHISFDEQQQRLRQKFNGSQL